MRNHRFPAPPTAAAVGAGHVVHPSAATSSETKLPCPYCRAAIPASRYAVCAPPRILMLADCPTCGRRNTVGARAWRRWMQPPPQSWDERWANGSAGCDAHIHGCGRAEGSRYAGRSTSTAVGVSGWS
jgi:hypothetical protein